MNHSCTAGEGLPHCAVFCHGEECHSHPTWQPVYALKHELLISKTAMLQKLKIAFVQYPELI